MMHTSVAIITRTKSRPLFLRRAIRSVLSQTYPHWKHVVVNDGGNQEEVEAILKSYSKEYGGRSEVFHHNTSLGMEAASNTGIRASSSDYILIHDDDDSLEPKFLEETVSYLENPPWPNIKGVATLTNIVTEQVVDEKICENKRTLFRLLKSCIRIDDMANGNQVPNISFLFQRRVLDEIGLFDDTLPVLGDWDFNLRFILKYDIGVIPKILANYHHRPGSKVGESSNTIYARLSAHELYDGLVRNRYMRLMPPGYIGAIMIKSERFNLLERLYRHPVIGAVIWLWSRFINSGIPGKLE